jgi:hypothetical protein
VRGQGADGKRQRANGRGQRVLVYLKNKKYTIQKTISVQKK